jgi:general secretion pathway protein J
MNNKDLDSGRMKKNGFTLLEILIALFIFTILSTMLVGALHSVINAQSGSEINAERLRQLQISLLVMSRDVEQTVNRPVVTAAGKEEAAFIGTPREFIFTHTGFANPTGTVTRSTLQRTRYGGDDNSLWRMSWSALDQAPQSQPHSRRLLTGVASVSFQYLDRDGRFHDNWPVEGEASQPLPRAVRVYLTISQWGKLSQLYVISAQARKTNQAPPAQTQTEPAPTKP